MGPNTWRKGGCQKQKEGGPILEPAFNVATDCLLLFTRYQFFVLGGGEEVVHLGGVAHVYERDPSFAVAVLVDRLRRVLHLGVDLLDAARDGRVEVGDRLARLDLAESLTGLDGGSRLGTLEGDDLSQLVLRVEGYPNGAVGAHPHVLFVILEILRVIIHTPSLLVDSQEYIKWHLSLIHISEP